MMDQKNWITILVLLGIVIVAGLVYVFYIRRKNNASNEEKPLIPLTSSPFIAGLSEEGRGQEFKTTDEGTKMISLPMLKNTVMSFSALKTLPTFNMTGPNIGPNGNAVMPVELVKPYKSLGKLWFVVRDGQYSKVAEYRGSDGTLEASRNLLDEIHFINLSTTPDFVINTSDNQFSYRLQNHPNEELFKQTFIDYNTFYPTFIREGLFYIRMAGTNLYIGGNINKDSNLSSLKFVQRDDINVDRNEFQKNSFTDFTDNNTNNLNNAALPILLELANKNDTAKEFTFTMKDSRGFLNNMKNIGISRQPVYLYPSGTAFSQRDANYANQDNYVIVDLRSARMFYKDTDNLYKLSNQWSKGNYDDYYRVFRFENTGLDATNNYGTSWYIYDPVAKFTAAGPPGAYLRRKPDGAVDAVADKKGYGKETRWYIKWDPQNSNDGYNFISAVDMKYLMFHDNGIMITVPESSRNRAFGVFREEDFHWTVYKLNREINPIGGNNRWLWNDWGNQGVGGNGILDGINKIGFNQTGGGTPFICFSSQSGHLTGMRDGNNREKAGGQWICTNSKNLVQNTLFNMPTMSVNNEARQFTFYVKNNKFYCKSGNQWLSWTYNKSEKIVIFSNNPDNASPIEFVPVLDATMSRNYFRASTRRLNSEVGTNRDSYVGNFCGTSATFPDGTLKIDMGEPNNLSSNAVTQAIEKICACNMNTNYYFANICSEKFIEDKFGIKPTFPNYSEIIQKLRATLRCGKPNCTFTKCKKVFDLTQDRVLTAPNVTDVTHDCGANVICISNQQFFNNGALEKNTINQTAQQECGGVGGASNPIQPDVNGDLSWLPNDTIGDSPQSTQPTQSTEPTQPIAPAFPQPTSEQLSAMPTRISTLGTYSVENKEFTTLISPNSQYWLYIDPSDGNVSVVRRSDNTAIWSIKGINKYRTGVPSPYRLVLQTDGNLVVYGSNNDYIFSAADTDKWIRNPNLGASPPYYLELFDTGNLIIKDRNNVQGWSTQ